MKLKRGWLIILASLIIIFGGLLRVVKLGDFPKGLYWEEVALGYDAYSILKTGADFHSQRFPLVAFESFGDYKPSGYFYAAAISEFFLGLNDVAVRLPSVLAGVGLIVLGMLLAREIFSQAKQQNWLILVSGLMIAFSPWALQFSRAAFEANLAAFFSGLGIWLLFKSQRRGFLLPLAALAFIVSIYTYHAARLFVPLLLIAYSLMFWRNLKKQWLWIILAGLGGCFLILPIIFKLQSVEVGHRFQETSAFTEVEPISKINQLREADGNTLLTRLIHHRYWYYSETFLRNLLVHFDPNYLFVSGDTNLRHSTGQVGVFYLIDAVFLIWGLAAIARKPDKGTVFLLVWWVAALVPAALTRAAPHALRTLGAIPAPQLIIAYGLVELSRVIWRRFKVKPWLWVGIVVAVYGLFVGRYLADYFGDYARRSATWWQVDYPEMIGWVTAHQDQYDQVYISRIHGRPSMYYFFYNQVDPQLVQAEEVSAAKDQGERLSFDKITFGLPGEEPRQSRVLIVAGSDEVAYGKSVWQSTNLEGLVFEAWEVINEP